MRFLVDAQLPPALARWLTAKGHEAAHVGDLGMRAASDAAIWDYALASSSAIVTKDEDFAQRKVLNDAARRLDQAAEHAATRSAGLVRGGAAGHSRRAGARRHLGRGHMKAATATCGSPTGTNARWWSASGPRLEHVHAGHPGTHDRQVRQVDARRRGVRRGTAARGHRKLLKIKLREQFKGYKLPTY